MATIKDVSRLANVSISTVSRVINNTAQVAPEKREAVLSAMKELNFRPNSFAQALVSKRSNCISRSRSIVQLRSCNKEQRTAKFDCSTLLTGGNQ